MLALQPVTLLAFWQSYFGRLADASIAHHIHGITGTAWILLIALQSWLIHHGKASAHRAFGRVLFLLVPIMIGAFALVTFVGAQQSVKQSRFYVLFGKSLLTADALLTFATAAQVYLALKFRNQLRIRSALMISTVLGLV